MNITKVFVGISLIGMAITVYSLGYAKLIGEAGSGTITIYPTAALGVVGALTLWSELKRA